MHLRTDTSSNAHFSSVPTISRSRNAFSVSQRHLTSIQFDYLYPIFWKYTYPGDTISITQSILARLATQVGPLYDDLYIDLHAWHVPFRLVQPNWARFQFNAQPTGPTQDNSALTTPKITLSGLGAGGFVAKTLYDYFGFPTEVDFSGDTEHINNYLGRSYNLIFNENYRDQNLQNAVTVDLDDGPDDPANYVLLKRGKRHDKFTSALTAQQKGTAVSFSLGTTAPVVTNSTQPSLEAGGVQYLLNVGTTNSAGSRVAVGHNAASPSLQNAIWGTNTGLVANLASATALTVNSMRTSITIQQLLEADARGGTRDVEAIQHRWGVTVPDFRLQRPEYMGGQTFSFDGNIVPQTSASEAGSPQANLAQFSQALSHFSINHSFVEHGVFMILVSARSNITYQQGLMRELSYRTRYDFYQPEFANLGEVAIKNKEIYAIGSTGVQDNATFGYQEYGYELRYSENRVSGEFRSNYATSLDSRHMADDYSSLPTLGAAWIVSNTAISRNTVVSAATADPIHLNTLASGRIVRTLPMYSVPGLTRI